MKKIFIISIALLLNACASDFQNYIIKQNNNIKSIKIKKVEDNYITSNNYAFKNNSKIAIRFNEISPDTIKEFEIRHNLKLEQILIIGDYIYSHKSNDILTLIKLITDENNVKQIVPLWNKSINFY
jgi:hypothetical protein